LFRLIGICSNEHDPDVPIWDRYSRPTDRASSEGSNQRFLFRHSIECFRWIGVRFRGIRSVGDRRQLACPLLTSASHIRWGNCLCGRRFRSKISGHRCGPCILYVERHKIWCTFWKRSLFWGDELDRHDGLRSDASSASRRKPRPRRPGICLRRQVGPVPAYLSCNLLSFTSCFSLLNCEGASRDSERRLML